MKTSSRMNASTSPLVCSFSQKRSSSANRAPDALGLNYWGGQLKDGMPLGDIAASFFVQPEAAAAYPAGQPTGTFVNAVYNNVLGRSADTAGLDWSGQLGNGAVGKNSFLLALISGATGPDVTYLGSKVAVGSRFALNQGLSDSAWAKTVMAGVNGTSASVTAADALTDGFAATAASAGGAELVVRVSGSSRNHDWRTCCATRTAASCAARAASTSSTRPTLASRPARASARQLSGRAPGRSPRDQSGGASASAAFSFGVWALRLISRGSGPTLTKSTDRWCRRMPHRVASREFLLKTPAFLVWI